ncbi:alpha-2 adrenergic receptor [Trichonephila clavipes]|nr:alpha-2 adrenergic receptor [Trichonephila clavipes]
MKIGNNGNLVLGSFEESTPCLMIVLMNCQTKLRINHLTAVKSVAILEMGPKSYWDPGNERADQKAKQEAESSQPEVPLTLRRVKSIISAYIDKSTAMPQKYWKAMVNPGHCGQGRLKTWARASNHCNSVLIRS